jgi:hypothetical protein
MVSHGRIYMANGLLEVQKERKESGIFRKKEEC